MANQAIRIIHRLRDTQFGLVMFWPLEDFSGILSTHHSHSRTGQAVFI